MPIPEIVFLGAILLLGYTYAGYPFLIWLASRVRSRPTKAGRFTPTVSVLVVAHNEEAGIGDKIRNLRQLDYPPELLEIVIASDGSTDDTLKRARQFASDKVKVLDWPGNRGKPAVLNEVIPELKGEIVVFADARQRIDCLALRALMGNFSDPSVGVVGGELVLLSDPDAGARGDGLGFYWRYEKFIRNRESRIDSTIGVSGALYAMRRSLFRPIPDSTLLDDVLIPMNVVRQGYRVVLEPKARVYDRIPMEPGQEFTRKVRTIAGNFQLFTRHPWLWNPRHNRLWFQMLSHKWLRLLGPALLSVALFSNLLLLHARPYQLLFSVQALFYIAAGIGHWTGGRRGNPGLVNVAHAFCLLNWATVVGFWRFVTGRQSVTWKQTRRVS